MIKFFRKNGIIKVFTVDKDKVFTTIESEQSKITNPSIDLFLTYGWEECDEPKPDSYVPTLEDLVEMKIREKYSINQEFQIQRKRDVEPEEFQDYYIYVENCIRQAKEQLQNEYAYDTN